MKSINNYINDSIEYQIDEGLKEWIKKAALTAAIATSCLNLNATPIEKVDSLNDYKSKTEQVQQIDDKEDISDENEDVEIQSKPLKFDKRTLPQQKQAFMSKIKAKYPDCTVKSPVYAEYSKSTNTYRLSVIVAF